MPRPTDRNVNYSLIYVLLAVIVICVLTFCGPRVNQQGFQERVLEEFKSDFQALEHIPGTETLVHQAIIGDFGDYEYGCDLFLAEVRQSDAHVDEIKANYLEQEVQGSPVQIIFIRDGQILNPEMNAIPEPLNNLAALQLGTEIDQQNQYLVYLFVEGYEGSPKLNCR